LVYIIAFINLNILGYLIWYCGEVILIFSLMRFAFSFRIFCSLNLFSVSIWYVFEVGSNFTPSWACLAHLEHWWPHFSCHTLRHVIAKIACCKSFRRTYHFSLFRTCDLSSEIIIFVKNKCVPRLQAQSCEMICNWHVENVIFQSKA